MAYDQKKVNEEDWEKRFPVFRKFQEDLAKENPKKYRFDITISNPKEKRLKSNHINSGSGFETCHIKFKGVNVAYVYPVFNSGFRENRQIQSMWIDARSWTEILSTINYTRNEQGAAKIDYRREGHLTLQSCIDELEKLRRVIVEHFSDKT